ncbi:hypothetical protein GYA49_04940 [Candidatus Beckwithbacteria bacterium]|nr:hypothetical protein [Candidatus Beckwithbacteria bacterium]
MEESKEHCGLVGIYLKKPNSALLYKLLLQGLYGLQHRGQEGSGAYILSSDGLTLIRREDGPVERLFEDGSLARQIDNKSPIIGLGHTRYSTSGDPDANQPFSSADFILVHNGNITNARKLAKKINTPLSKNFQSDTDIFFKYLLSSKGRSIETRIRHALENTEGAANFIIISPANRQLFAYRDPWGFHPLILGEIPQHGYIVASENNFFSNAGVNMIREIAPGEGITIDDNRVKTFFIDDRKKSKRNQNGIPTARCIFEQIYFAAPDSYFFKHSVAQTRRTLGACLAQDDIKAGFFPEVTIPIQHSGNIYVEGYAQAMISYVAQHWQKLGINKDQLGDYINTFIPKAGLIANYAARRVFIHPTDRNGRASLKHRPDPHVVAGKKVVIIDDSIVRSTTIKEIVKALRKAKAEQIHVRVGCPPIIAPCFMGIDFPNSDDLIANRCKGNIEKMRQEIGCNSLRFVSHKQLITAANGLHELKGTTPGMLYKHAGFCGACFTNNYPTGINTSGVFSKSCQYNPKN